jgi:hypothetical protein
MNTVIAMTALASVLAGLTAGQDDAGRACPPGCDTPRRVIDVSLLYLDLSTCDRCQGTAATLDAAVASVAPLFRQVGVEVRVRKVHVRTLKEAEALRFSLSPTVRIDGTDIAPDLRTSDCKECGDLGECNVACRVWAYEGRETTIPPQALLVDALLRAYGAAPRGAVAGVLASPAEPFSVPEDMKRFFAARADCCEPGSGCCEKAQGAGKEVKKVAPVTQGSCCGQGEGCCAR